MRSSALRIGLLLFGSGMCALIYQTAWVREFRLVFGASTAASAAVLAIFMGGLGLGSLLLGRRADRAPRPLMMYAHLELAIAASAAATPLLLWAARSLYIATGGSTVLGDTVGTLARLALSALVLAVPTILMGGTLPAAARAAETDDDMSRRNLALLYGLNTIGAVVGTLLSTFFLLEIFGNQRTLWLACLVNALVGLTARVLSRKIETADGEQRAEAVEDEPAREVALDGEARPVPAPFVLAAAAIVGFVFLLMEIVWYRMLGPILGGTTFTFGIILAIALFGIGAGGALYAVFWSNRRTTLTMFATSCAIEAAFIALPFALGDNLAILSGLLRPLGNWGFWGFVTNWTIIAVIVVLPAALVSGIQFPILISLLGSGRREVGRHVGSAYAANTLGAIAGSLAGGFGILPLLTATGTWVFVVVALLVLCAASSVLLLSQTRNLRPLIPSAVAITLAALLLVPAGPTEVWRHSPIGAGRVPFATMSANEIVDFKHTQRRVVPWSVEGVESSVALDSGSGYAFIVNGKSDGHAVNDAPTAVNSAILGGLLHPRPKNAFVVGLGTGSTAGWFGALPDLERVDVVELEPAIVEVAERCTPVNRDALRNPKVHLSFGDAREVLITTPKTYDIIFSEPSNPYRAGVSSLYTREFYESARERLTDNGIFLQWLQAYEVDGVTIQTVLATLGSVFPEVQVWQTQPADLLLVASKAPIVCDVPTMRAKLATEPFKSATRDVWLAEGLEGVLARFIADAPLARALTHEASIEICTDDRNLVEFGFARTLGKGGSTATFELIRAARQARVNRPRTAGGPVDWNRVEQEVVSLFATSRIAPTVEPQLPLDERPRARAKTDWILERYSQVANFYRHNSIPNPEIFELRIAAESLAREGDAAALPFIEAHRAQSPIEADALLGRLRATQGRVAEASAALERAFIAYRTNPWPDRKLMEDSLTLAVQLAQADSSGMAGNRYFEILGEPFVLSLQDEARRMARFRIARVLEGQYFGELTRQTVVDYEPNVPWTGEFLYARYQSYEATGDPRTAQARRDALAFAENSLRSFGFGTRFEAAPVEPVQGKSALWSRR
jgi:spermidine synthase/MFS family permease